jgi:hypothetical protein
MSPALSTAAISYVLTIKTRRAAINDCKLQPIDLNAQPGLANTTLTPNLSANHRPEMDSMSHSHSNLRP